MDKVSISDLYKVKPVEVTTHLSDLNGCYYQHIPELNLDEIPFDWETKTSPNTRVTRRILHRRNYDFRRYWELTTVWLDDRPVMVVQNAGREGDDHTKRFITDPVAYAEMVSYLLTVCPVAQPEDHVDADEPRADLIYFYGDGFSSLERLNKYKGDFYGYEDD